MKKTLGIIILIIIAVVIVSAFYKDALDKAELSEKKYQDEQKKNIDFQEEKNLEIAENKKIIDTLNFSLKKNRLESKDIIKKLKDEIKKKPKWKLVKEKEVEYVYLPLIDFSKERTELLTLRKENTILKKILDRWKDSYEIAMKKFKSEKLAHMVTKSDRVIYKKKYKKQKTIKWVAIVVGIIAVIVK